MTVGTGEREVGPDQAYLRAARALYVDGVTAEVVTAMEGAGVPAIVLKGPSIARWLYPSGGRTYADTDLLVPPSELARAGSLLRALGFIDRHEGIHPLVQNDHPVEISFTRPRVPGVRRGGNVDLHRNIPGFPCPDDLLWENFRSGCETMRVGGVEVRIPNRACVALHVVVHAVQHAFGFHTDEDLRRAIDAQSLEEWREVAVLAKRLGVDDVVGFGLRRHPEGAGIADRLGLPELALADSWYLWRLAPRGAKRLSILCSAPTVRDKARVVRGVLLPSPARIRFEPGLSAARERPLVVRYLRYWLGAARSMRAALRFVVDDQRRRRSRGDRVPLRSPWSDRLLLLEAGLCLGWTRAGVLLLPFRWVTSALGQQVGETPTTDDPATLVQRQRVAWAVQRVGRHASWAGTCLTQALAGKQMLRRRGIASTLYLGVAKDSQANLNAHAWLRSGTVTLTGGDHLARFRVIASFADTQEAGFSHGAGIAGSK